MKRFHPFKIVVLVLLLLISGVAQAQEKTAGTDFMRSNGRIYVVIAVILTILAGIILYLVRLERKIKRLEKEN